MNNEVKEILDDLDYCKNKKSGYINLKSDDCDDLLDYINNLQQQMVEFKTRCFRAYKLIYDNYGILDKFSIDLLEDILTGDLE